MNAPKAIRPIPQDKLDDFYAALDTFLIEGMSPLAVLRMSYALGDKDSVDPALLQRAPQAPDKAAYETLRALINARGNGDAEAIAQARSAAERQENFLRDTYSGDDANRHFVDVFSAAKDMAYGDRPLTRKEVEEKARGLEASYTRPGRPRTH